jgi:hypothetical protein
MLGIPIRYLLRHPITGVADLVADPIEVWTTILDTYAAERERRGPQCPYEPDLRWEQHLHEALGAPWPSDEALEFLEVWHQVIGELEAKGIRAGPESFQRWNDGDAGLVRAIWCLTRHLRPQNVVETGVAHVSRRASFLRHSRGTEMAIFGVLIFHPSIGLGASRSALPLVPATQIDGHTSRVRVGAAFPDCFMT